MELNIEDLQESIGQLVWQVGIEKFKITESFKITGVKEMTVSGLGIEIEQDMAMCYDDNFDILNNRYVAMCFLIDSVRIFRENSTTFKLEFEDGNITIQCINK